MSPGDERDGGSAPQPVLTVAAVARRLGVAPSTLRTWDRRYDLGPSTHTAGSHRRYNVDDLARLVVMRGLVQEGVPPAEAAQIALTSPVLPPPDIDERTGIDEPTGRAPLDDAFFDDSALDRLLPALASGSATETAAGSAVGSAALDPGLVTSIPVARGEGEWGEYDVLAELSRGLFAEPEFAEPEFADPEFADPGLAETQFAEGRFAEPEPESTDEVGLPAVVSPGHRRLRSLSTATRLGVVARHGGGRVVALPDGSPQARGLARAAMSLDTREVARLLRAAVHAYGVVSAWEAMAMPVLQALGDRWQATGEGVDVEHAFSEAVISVMHGVTDALDTPRNTCPVLLTCAESEQHSIPLHVLAAALAEVGIGCRMLGEGMPAASLIAAVRRTGPAVVFVYARLPVGDPDVLDHLPRQRPAPRVVLGGPGWRSAQVPGSVLRVDTLGSAVVEVVSGVHL
jgi:hypothetical protein